MATMTFRAPLHRSMAPYSKARPGVAQLARSPCADTCRPPSTVAARRPQRMTLKDMATSKALLPGTGDEGHSARVDEALVFHQSLLHRGADADEAVLALEEYAVHRVAATEAWDADAQVDHVAGLEVGGRPLGDKVSVVHCPASLRQNHVHEHAGHLDLVGAELPRSQKWSHSTMDSAPQVAITGWEAWPLLPL